MVKALSSEDKSIYGNPWRADQWNITTQGAFVVRYGIEKAKEFAKSAGTVFNGPKPGSAEAAANRRVEQYILIKKIGGGGGTGSSGSGPPS